METLSGLIALATIVVELLGLGLTAWLGLMVLTLAPRHVSPWFAAPLFWSFSLVFALSLLQSAQPLVPEKPWLPYDLLRWLLIPLPLAWLWLLHHLLPIRARPMLQRALHVAVLAFIVTVAVAALVGPLATFAQVDSERWSSLFYPVYLTGLLVAVGPTVWLTFRSARLIKSSPHRNAIRLLAVATLLAILGAFYRVGGFWVFPTVPTFPGDVILLLAFVGVGAALVLQGIGDGKANGPAFIYNLANAAAISLLYTFVVGGATILLDVSWVVLVVVVPLAISSHWLTEWSRSLFDTFFYRVPVQRLRNELRTLMRMLDRDQPLEPQVQLSLARLGAQIDAAGTMVLVPGEDSAGMRLLASCPLVEDVEVLPELPPLTEGLVPISISPPFSDPVCRGWAVSLVDGEQQLGVLLAWPRPRECFDDLDLALLQEAGSQLALLLAQWHVQSQRLADIEELVARYRAEAESLQGQLHALAAEPGVDLSLDEVTQKARTWVEEALRNLHNVAYLGQHPLSQLQVINERLVTDGVAHLTHLERGRAVRELCEELIERLRPTEAASTEPYPPEWRLYLVLHAAYVEGEPNREIMSRLYIGEGTFHRARRQALASVAEALVELERAAHERIASTSREQPPVSSSLVLPGALDG